MRVGRAHTQCRVCEAPLGDPYLDLGVQPLANRLRPVLPDVPELNDLELRAPLAVALCTSCGLSQLTVVVAPEILYSGYRFRSGASRQWAVHCDLLASQASDIFKKPGVVIDIAANDGTQLLPFWERGWTTIGVEPAEIEPACPARVVRQFWNGEVAAMLRTEHKPADLVIAQNVLGHVDDPVGFLKAVEHVLAPDGLCVVEVPHIHSLLHDCAFDTIYHEHLSYWSTGSLVRAAKRAGLALWRQERLPRMHGGSRRYWFRRGEIATNPVYDIPIDPHPYQVFANDVERRLQHVKRVLAELHGQDAVIGAYGASAKGAVMLNTLKARGNSVWPVSIVDDVKEKQGFLSPGIHVPIVAPENSGMIEWDVCWILSWNWAEQLKAKARTAGFRGEFLVTHPNVRLGE